MITPLLSDWPGVGEGSKRCRFEQSPHGGRLCAMFRPGTSLNLGAGLEYHLVLDGPRMGRKPNDFATYRKREPTGVLTTERFMR